MVKARKKPFKLTLAKAVKYYRAGYPEDGMCTLEFCKLRPVEAAELIEEISAFVTAPTLEEACKLAVEFDYGCNFDDPPGDWRSHVEGIAAIRRAAGHYEPDYSPESIVKDLLKIAVNYNAVLNEAVGQHEKAEFRLLLNATNCLADRLEMVYGDLMKEFE